MAEDIGLMDAIYSQRQITRYRRDPVSREDIEKIIDAAIRAPSGGNTQPWHFIAITDRDLIEKIGGLYRDIWLGAQGAEPRPDEPPAYRQARHLANRMPEVPAMILICADHSKGSAPYTPGQPIERGRYASSIWLAIQNLFLAARALGLGTRITTVHIRGEEQIKEWLGIPEHVETVCLTPLGYPRGSFGPTQRTPAEEVSSFNHYGSR
jgi:nitroreductase